MQTKKWGPAAWKFNHAIVYRYPDNPSYKDRKLYKNFFEVLGTQLPCKYCRMSWSGFSSELPIDSFLGSRDKLAFWLYTQHNKVNKKLRDQGNPVDEDPSFHVVCKKYWDNQDYCTQMYWDFLHAITYNYPTKPSDQQKVNTRLFFESLKYLFPCQKCSQIYRILWKKIPINEYLESRHKLTYWLYLIHKNTNEGLIKLGYPIQPLPDFTIICERYENMRAKCSDATKTCSIPLTKK